MAGRKGSRDELLAAAYAKTMTLAAKALAKTPFLK